MRAAIRGLRCHRPGNDRVRIAPPVQQEELVFHIRKRFWIKGHAHEVEVRVESVNLQRVLDVVGSRAVSVVVCILDWLTVVRVRLTSAHHVEGLACGINRASWQRRAAKNIRGWITGRT